MRTRSSSRLVGLVLSFVLVASIVIGAQVPRTQLLALPPNLSSKCKRVGSIRITSSGRQICSLRQGIKIWVPFKSPTSSPTPIQIPPSTTVPINVENLVSPASCRLADPNAAQTGLSIGFPRVSHRLKSTGEIRIGVVFVDFPDSIATRTTSSVFSLFSPGAEERFRDMSYGKANFVLIPLHKWIRMGNPSSTYLLERRNLNFIHEFNFINEALAKASNQLDWQTIDGFLVISNPDTELIDVGPAFTANHPYWAERGTGYGLMNGARSGADILRWPSGWVNHELGHAMGLLDLYAYVDLLYPNSFHRFVGWFSMMGNAVQGSGAPEYFGWERWSLGWIDDSQVGCLKSGTVTIDIDPIEQPGGTKMLVVPLGDHRVLVIESRRKLGHDAMLLKEGVLVYLVDLSVASGMGAIRVLPINDNDSSKLQNILQVGETLSYSDVKVSVNSSSTGGDRVTVTSGN